MDNSRINESVNVKGCVCVLLLPALKICCHSLSGMGSVPLQSPHSARGSAPAPAASGSLASLLSRVDTSRQGLLSALSRTQGCGAELQGECMPLPFFWAGSFPHLALCGFVDEKHVFHLVFPQMCRPFSRFQLWAPL